MPSIRERCFRFKGSGDEQDRPLVSVTVETEAPKREPKPEFLLELERVRKTLPEFVTVEDAVDRIRSLRSEWDD
jgi:hypothetical protein